MLATALFGVAAVIILLLLFSEIFLFLYVARADSVRTTINYSLFNLIRNVFLAIGYAVQGIFSVLSNAASFLLPFFALFSVIAVFIIFAEVHTIFQSNIYQSVDGKITAYFLPFYKEVILPLAHLITIIYESVICWWNSAGSVYRVLYVNLYKTLLDCTIAQWVDITQVILDIYSTFCSSLIEWIRSGWQDDFNWKPVLENAGRLIDLLVGPATCLCQDLFFAFDYIGQISMNIHLHYTIQHLLNAIFSIVRTLATAFFHLVTLQLFASPDFGCDSLLPFDEYTDCIAKRPPDFFQTFNLTCLAVTNFTVFVDEGLEQVVITFTGDSSANIIPDLFAPIGSTVCAVIHSLENINDFVWHVDLSFDIRIQMFLRLKTHNIIDYLFTAADQFDVFFTQIDTQIVGPFGCTLTNILRALIQILDFFLRLLKVTANNIVAGLGDGGASIEDFLINYPYFQIKDYLHAASLCLDLTVQNINDPLAKALRALINALSEFVDMLIDLASNAKKKKKRDIQDVIINIIAPKYGIFKGALTSLAIATGNIIRQFEIRPGCTVRNPFNSGLWDSPPPNDGFFCAVGATVEDLLRFIFGLGNIIVDPFIAGLAGSSLTAILDQNNLSSAANIDVHFFNSYARLVRDVASLLPNLFVYINTPVVNNCFAEPLDLTGSKLTNALESALRGILFLVDIIVLLLKAIANAIAGTFDFCPDLVQPAYNATIGRFFDFLVKFLLFLNCLGGDYNTDNGFADFLVGVDDLFGINGDFISGICDIFEALGIAFELIYTLFTDPAGFFAAVGEALVAVFNCIFDELGLIFSNLVDTISSFFSLFGECIVDFFTDTVGYCLECFCSDDPCGVIPTSCNNFASGNFVGMPDWTNIGDNFQDCIDDIEFDPGGKKKRDVFDDIETRFNLTVVEELEMAKQYCAPLFERVQELVARVQANGINETSGGRNISAEDRADAFLLKKELNNCMYSAISSRVVEKYLLFIDDPGLEVIPRSWIYDYGQTFNFTIQFGRLLWSVGYYEYKKFEAYANNSAYSSEQVNYPSWPQYLYDNNLHENQLLLRGGFIMTRIIDKLLDTNNQSRSLPSMILNITRVFFGKQSVYDFWLKGVAFYKNTSFPGLNSTLVKRTVDDFTSLNFIPEVYDSPLYKRNVQDEYRTKIQNMTFYRNIQRAIDRTVEDKARLRFITAPLRYARRIQQRITWNDMGRPTNWRYGIVPPNTIYTEDDVRTEFDIFIRKNRTTAYSFIMNHMPTITVEGGVQSFSGSTNDTDDDSSQPLEKRTAGLSMIASLNPLLPYRERDGNKKRYPQRPEEGNIPGVDLCIADACLHCTYLERVIDDFIDLFYLCIEDARDRPPQLDQSLRVSSIDGPVLASIDPDFWERKRSALGATHTSAVIPYNALQPSLQAQFLNHESLEDMEQLDIVLSVQSRFMKMTEHEQAKRATLTEISDKFTRFTDRGFSVIGLAFDGLEWVFQRLFGVSLKDSIISFVRVISGPGSQSEFLFWFRFYRNCNYFDNPRCNVGRQGYGLVKGLWVTLLAFAIVTGIILAIAQIPIVGMAGWLLFSLLFSMWIFLFYPVFQSVAYFSSPNCAYFVPIPILPNCLANDIYVELRDLYAPCINFDGIGLPGLTTSECPPPFSRCVSLSNFSEYYAASDESECVPGTVFADDNERIFVDCSQEPYNFIDGFRNLFFILRDEDPDLYQSVIDTTFAPIRFFLDLGPVSSATEFDFSASGGVPDDTWRSCNKISTPNWVSLIFLLSSTLAVLGSIVIGLLAVAIIAWLILLALVQLWAVIIATLTGYKNDISQIDNQSSRYLQDQRRAMAATPRPTVVPMPPPSGATASSVQTTTTTSSSSFYYNNQQPSSYYSLPPSPYQQHPHQQ